MFCQHCGSSIDAGAQFCPSCGLAQRVPGAVGTAPGPAVYVHTGTSKAKTGHWIGQGWEIVKSDLGMFALMALAFAAVNGLVPFLIQGALAAGFHMVIMKKILTGRVDFADLFSGFNFFVPTLVATLVISIFVFAGSLLCVIPGFVVAAMYKFTYLFIIDKRMEFWPAMQASHAVVKGDYFGYTIFLGALALLNIAGVLCCIVGLLVTIPITYAAITVAYRETVGFEAERAPATT